MMNFERSDVLERGKKVAHCLKGISHELRLSILFALSEGEKNVRDLTQMLQIPQPTLSGHLRLMLDRGILEVRREGNQMFYRVSNERIFDLMGMVREIFCD